MAELAVFPIPDCVAFPGTVLPLHVFEPRYRQMVEHCLKTDSLLAVCHVEKTLHSVPTSESPSDMLHTNLDTYKPMPVCSGGRVEIIKTLNDGRLLINVHLQQRYTLGDALQTLPFMIYEAGPLEDINEPSEQLEILKDKLLHRITALTKNQTNIQRLITSEQWRNKPVKAFSFEIFSLIQSDPKWNQSILENRSAAQRLQQALDLLQEIPAQL